MVQEEDNVEEAEFPERSRSTGTVHDGITQESLGVTDFAFR
jgi:hypothetical protein